MLHTPRGRNGMVTSPHHLASQAGLSVLKDGGSALEAAVATGACLTAVYPHMNHLGGDAFFLVSLPDGSVRAIDACGAAAQAASPALYRDVGHDAVPTRGPLAANTVAGLVSGWRALLELAEQRLPLERLLRDAILYAEDGACVGPSLAAASLEKGNELKEQPGFADVFRPGGAAPQEGDVLRQPALARTLMTLASEGLGSFYTGALASRIAEDLEATGSPVTADDLRKHTARVAEPLRVRIKGVDLFNHPPPSQGMIALSILALYDQIPADEANGFDHVHRLIEATKRAMNLARSNNIGDPAFMPEPAQSVLDQPGRFENLAQDIDLARAAPWSGPGQTGDTVWFSAADADGAMVSCIQSVFFEFGSGVVLPQTGIVWQNRGSSFALEADSWNALAPARKPFHTLNPALARFDDGRMMAYGAMGGEGQPQSQAAVFSRYAHHGATLQSAVTAPRWLLGRTWGDPSVSLKVEERFGNDLIQALAQAGHDTECSPAFSDVMGHAGAIVRRPDGVFEGAADPRSEGAVATW